MNTVWHGKKANGTVQKSDDEGQMAVRTDVQELIKAVKKRDHQMLSTPSGNHQHLTST